MEGGEGREGDWDCSGCGNRNYAFRTFCNRCKQPRLLVDIKTPADSKWLPRISDWICTESDRCVSLVRYSYKGYSRVRGAVALALYWYGIGTTGIEVAFTMV